MILLDQLHRHAAERPEQLAVRECATGKAVTWTQLSRAVSEFAAQLQRSDPSNFILQSGNGVEFHIAFLACLSAGHSVFPISCDVAERELGQAIKRSAAAGVIKCDLELTFWGKSPGSTASALATGTSQIPSLLLQSSGTTALPKIVCRPAPTIDAAASQIVQSIGLSHADQILSCVPLSHSYGLEHGLLAPILAGASVHLTQGLDIALIGRELSHSNITVLPAIPTVFEMLTQFDDLPRLFSRLHLAYSAGGPLPVEINERFANQFGIHIGQIYGASEIGSVTFSDPRSASFNPSSVGIAMSGAQLRTDFESQLLVRAPSMMRGYVDADPPFCSDGFFPTGDLARIDDIGQLFLLGRSKLLIDIGGRKVNPLEVEQAMKEHPAISECVVISIPQTQTLRRLKAIFVPAESHRPPTTEQLRQFLKDRLTPYKIPRVFESRTSLPRSAAGKIQRHLLEQS